MEYILTSALANEFDIKSSEPSEAPGFWATKTLFVFRRSTNIKIKQLAALALLLPFLSPLWAQDLTQQLQSILTNRKLMGMSVSVVAHDSVVYSHGFGTADFARGIPTTDSTLYRIASISKSVTATALMVLYDQGLFQLDEDVSTALGFSLRNPAFPNTPITYRMLLDHTSSIQDGTGYGPFSTASFDADPPPPISSMLATGGQYFTANMFRTEEPGTFFTYTNVGYGILGTLVEKLSDMRFDVFCREQIFAPLGLTASFNIQDFPTHLHNIAVLYRKPNGVWTPQSDNYLGVMPPPRDLSVYPIGSNAFIFGPQGGLRISGPDLTKYMLMHMGNGILNGVRVLSDSTTKLMHTPQWTYDGSNGDNYYGLFRQWGLGFQITTNAPGGDIVFPYMNMTGHAGEAYGLISDMYFDTTRNMGIVFITNGCGNAYQSGTATSFYTVEEDVFNAVYQTIIEPVLLPTAEAAADKMQLFPNPANGSVELFFQQPFDLIRVLNSMGELVLTLRNSGTFSTRSLPAGHYLVQVLGNKNQLLATHRLVVH